MVMAKRGSIIYTSHPGPYSQTFVTLNKRNQSLKNPTVFRCTKFVDPVARHCQNNESTVFKYSAARRVGKARDRRVRKGFHISACQVAPRYHVCHAHERRAALKFIGPTLLYKPFGIPEGPAPNSFSAYIYMRHDHRSLFNGIIFLNDFLERMRTKLRPEGFNVPKWNFNWRQSFFFIDFFIALVPSYTTLCAHASESAIPRAIL